MSSVDLIPGAQVRARGLRWEVVLTEPLREQLLVRLRALDGSLRGEEFDLLYPFESVERVSKDFDTAKPAPLRSWWVYHQAFLLEQTLGRNALSMLQPGKLKLEPYQLVPVLRAVQSRRPRLLLADGVGLGKTIQAGLILIELIARRLAHRVLIVSPPGPLLEQWCVELSQRFGIQPIVLDRAKLEEIKRTAELGANPFDFVSLGVASIDFLKQEKILQLLERTSYDLVIIDEAHHCFDPGGDSNREDSQRRKLAEVLARKSDALLLLTATPHDGNDRSLASLCELLDPSLVDGRGMLRKNFYQKHVIRRLKRHIKDPATNQPLFKEREVIPVKVGVTLKERPAFEKLHREFLEFISPQLQRAIRTKSYEDFLSFFALLKRSVSTVAAFASTLKVVRDRIGKILTAGEESIEGRKQRLRSLKELKTKLDRFGSLSSGEELELESLETEDIAQQLSLLEREVRSEKSKSGRTGDTLRLLDSLLECATAALAEDPKLDQILFECRGIREREPNASILIYTEYATSQRALGEILSKAGLGTVLTLSGDDDEETRSSVAKRFQTEERLILASTDTAAEGLNLHYKCHHLIHLELPFNPNRLEQRNGRIDRYGQNYTPIVRYLYLQGTFEERILMRLVAKVERQRSALTFVPNTLGLATAGVTQGESLLKGLLEQQSSLFAPQDSVFSLESAAEDTTSSAAVNELLNEIDRSLRKFEDGAKSQKWLVTEGLGSAQSVATQAEKAKIDGDAQAGVNLIEFVCDAINLSKGDAKLSSDGLSARITPPANWRLHLAPSESAGGPLTIVAPTSPKSSELNVHIVARAHPLVRRSVERVRSFAFGSEGALEDLRVTSATSSTLKTPALLLTYLQRIESAAGVEFESVVGGIATEREIQATFSGGQKLADTMRTLKPTRGMELWKRQFSAWGETARRSMAAHLEASLQSETKAKAEELLAEVKAAREELNSWLKDRVELLTGDAVTGQASLFQPDANLDAIERARAVATSRDVSPHKRSEADGIVRLYESRMRELDGRAKMLPSSLVPIGLVMILPET